MCEPPPGWGARGALVSALDIQIGRAYSLDGKGMPKEWKRSVVVPIFKGKGVVINCGAHRGVKLLEHAMKIVKRVLENRIRRLVTMDDMQFGYMPGNGILMHCLFLGKCNRSFEEESKSCTCALWTWKRHLIGYQEK